MNLLIAAFLVAHALIHASYLAPTPPRTAGGPEWPFELTRSWLVTGLQLDPAAARALGIAMVAATVVILAVAGLATAGWIVPPSWWAGVIVAGAVCSLLTLALFFHPWLAFGILIDAALLWAVLIGGWQPVGGAS